jgi:hypothetical protein
VTSEAHAALLIAPGVFPAGILGNLPLVAGLNRVLRGNWMRQPAPATHSGTRARQHDARAYGDDRRSGPVLIERSVLGMLKDAMGRAGSGLAA